MESRDEVGQSLQDFLDMKDLIKDQSSGKWQLMRDCYTSPEVRKIAECLARINHSEVMEAQTRTCKNADLYVDGESFGSMLNPNVEELLKLATPAPFGKGSTTVLDETVRKAFHIDGDRVSIKNHYESTNQLYLFDPLPDAFLGAGPFGMCAYAELYKLHIYPPGGHFTEHVDTQHGPDHFMSAIVILGSEHDGGKLVIKGMDRDFHISPQPNKEHTLTAAAWYTDLLHNVEAVTSGYRVVLQYDIFFSKQWLNADETYESTSGIYRALANFEENPDESWQSLDAAPVSDNSDVDADAVDLKDKPFEMDSNLMKLRDVVYQYICCNTTEGIDSGKTRPLALVLGHNYMDNSLDAAHLKGKDRTIYDTLVTHPDLSITFEHLIIGHTVNGSEPTSIEQKDMYVWVRPLRLPQSKNKDSIPPPEQAHVIVGPHKRSFQKLLEEDYIEHTGNEAQEGSMTYHTAAMVIQLRKLDGTSEGMKEPPKKKARK